MFELRWSTLTRLMLALALASAALAQPPQSERPVPESFRPAGFETRLPPRGTVRDSSGEPIGGAVVRFRIERDSPDAVHWRNHVLRRQPLPQVRSSRDGEFFLPLTALHRLFTRQTAGSISLVVEKPGYHPWIEPLTTGLAGYLGSAVVLRRVADRERLKVKVADPRPGMLVRVHRFASTAVRHLDDERFYQVPKSGELTVVLSFVPTPVTLGTLSNMTLPIGIEVQLIHPERATAPVRLRFGQRTFEFDAKIPALKVEEVCSLGRADRQPLVRPRGLYRGPDGTARWFPVDPKRVVESRQLVLVAVDDEGCLAVNVPYVDPSIDRIMLEPIAEAATRVLELRDARGRLVDTARVLFFDLAALPDRLDARRLSHLRARRRLTAKAGRVDFSSLTLPGPGFLLVHARGFSAQLYFEPRQIVGVKQLDLGRRQRFGKIELTVADEDGVPVRGAHIAMNSMSFGLGAFNGAPLRTDQSGRITIDYLQPGSHSIQVLGPGLSQALVSVRVRPSGDTVKKAVVVARTASYRIVLVDGSGRPVPFGPVRLFGSANELGDVGLLRTSMRVDSALCADSLGRIKLSGYSKTIAPQVTDLFNLAGQPAVPLGGPETIARVTVGTAASVVMPLPGQVVTKECLTVNGRTVTRTVPRTEGGALLLARFPVALRGAVLSIYLAGAAPMRLTADLVDAASQAQSARPVLVDQRKIARRVRVRIRGLDGVKVDEFRLETTGLNFRGGKPYLYGDSGLRLRRQAGVAAQPEQGTLWSVGVRDGGAFTARILHPKFLMQTIEIPKAGSPDQTLAVDLQRGSPIEFRVSSKSTITPAAKLYFYVHSMANEMLLYQHESLGAIASRLSNGRWRVRSPVAMKPGRYKLTLRIAGTSVSISRRAFTIVTGQPLVLEVADRTVKEVAAKDLAPERSDRKR